MKITPDTVFNSHPGFPEPSLIIHQSDNSGELAIVEAARDIAAGKKVRFALCEKEPHKAPVYCYSVTVAKGFENYPRVCSSSGDPDGYGSYAMGRPDPTVEAIDIAVSLTYFLRSECFRFNESNLHFYRLKNA